MEIATVSMEDDLIISALETNDFDVVGLATFEFDETTLTRCLQTVHSILQTQRQPRRTDRSRLAQVLFAMVTVAREDYAIDGHQEFWPYLFPRIRASNPKNQLPSMNQSHQSLLGDWFRTALKAFDYSIPKGGPANIGPIIFHSVPRTSLSGAIQVISAACKHHGLHAESLPLDIRKSLVENFQPPLHINLQRLLGSNLEGAAQLWTCLARVVLAWQARGNCDAELSMLPPALDPELVRNALPSENSAGVVARNIYSQIRYDVETGEVRLVLPKGTASNWSITDASSPVPIYWDEHYGKLTADFRSPLPEVINVTSDQFDSSQDRIIYTRPHGGDGSEWPGIWFHAHNGNLEDGRVIDSAGLTAGRWFVLFEGTPTFCSVPFERSTPLKWTYSTDWTAWEIEIPPRTADATHLEWRVGDNSFKVPLAKRSAAKTEFLTKPVASAYTSDDNSLIVFDTVPSIILRRERELKVHLTREFDYGIELVDSFILTPEEEYFLDLAQFGVYQIREASGVGRILQRFAYLPSLEITSPNYSNDLDAAWIRFGCSKEIGELRVSNGELQLDSGEGSTFNLKFSTIHPYAEFTWTWLDKSCPDLTFRSPLDGLRWKVTGIPQVAPSWTRDPVFLDPSMIAQHDAQLEIQIPHGTDIEINYTFYQGLRQNYTSGDSIVVPLASYGELIELSFGYELYTSVVKSKKPILKWISGMADHEELCIEFETQNLPPKLAAIAWDPFDFLNEPKSNALTPEQIQSKSWEARFEQLPDCDFIAVTIATVVQTGFKGRSLQYAVCGTNASEPIALLIHRPSGKIVVSTSLPRTFEEMLLSLALQRLHKALELPFGFADSLLDNDLSKDTSTDDYFKLLDCVEKFLASANGNEVEAKWAKSILTVLRDQIARGAKSNPANWLNGRVDSEDRITKVLRLGVNVGSSVPFHFAHSADRIEEHSVYPVDYIQDLWLVSTPPSVIREKTNASAANGCDIRSQQRLASGRLFDFQSEWELPSIFEFLPLSSRLLSIHCSDKEHSHAFCVIPQRNSKRDSVEFAELLGLEEKAIDCVSTSKDQFFEANLSVSRSLLSRRRERLLGKKKYSLFWLPEKNRWVIENPEETPALCCQCNGESLLSTCLSQSQFIERLSIRDLVHGWSKGADSNRLDDFKFVKNFESCLQENYHSGEIHNAILKRPKQLNRTWLGTEVMCNEFDPINETARIAWQLSWIERWIAWEGKLDIVQYGYRQRQIDLENVLPFAIAEAMARWPSLMRRTLAFAELVYWTFHRRGIGVAANFD